MKRIIVALAIVLAITLMTLSLQSCFVPYHDRDRDDRGDRRDGPGDRRDGPGDRRDGPPMPPRPPMPPHP